MAGVWGHVWVCVSVVVVVIGRSHAAGPRVVGGSPARHRAPDDVGSSGSSGSCVDATYARCVVRDRGGSVRDVT